MGNRFTVKSLGKKSPKKQKPLGKKSADPSAGLCPVWIFTNIDNDGRFAFNPQRDDFDTSDFVTKLIHYSNMSWSEIEKQTHDNGKSKHHFLNEGAFSDDAEKRIRKKNLEDKTDSIFSFAFNNKTRIIGIRDGANFQVIWYDANHEFATSTKKHT